ncbi:4237_t:CDS:2 [Rhizophagus irregularis]|nr:4237_t:CDS:2 [Rhizophagus irregularis]
MPLQNIIVKKDLYRSTYSYYNFDIKSKKAEWMKNGISTIPNNDNKYNQRFSILSLPDDNNNNILNYYIIVIMW